MDYSYPIFIYALLLALLTPTQSTLRFQKIFEPYDFTTVRNSSYQARYFTLITIDFEHQQSFAGTCQINNQPCYFYMSQKDEFRVQLSQHVHTPSTQLRNFHSNTLNSGKYLYFDNDKAYLITNLNLVSQLPSKPTFSKIQNIVFGLTTNDYYILYSHQTTNRIGKYEIQFYQQTTYKKSIILEVSEIHDQLRFDGDYLYATFAKNIFVFDRNLNQRIKLEKQNAIDKNYLDITSNSIYFCLSYLTTLQCYNKQTYLITLNEIFQQNIIQIKFQSFLIYISTINHFIQFDYQQNKILETVYKDPGFHSIGYSLPLQKLFLFKPYPQNNKFLNQYFYNYQIQKNWSPPVCLNSYFFTTGSSFCTKNQTAYEEWKNLIFKEFKGGQQPDPILPVDPVGPVDPGDSVDPVDPVDPVDTVDPPLPQQQPEQPEQELIEESNSLVDFLNQEIIISASQALGKTLTFASFKIAPNFLLSFTCFLDDIWFYRYHSYVYSKSVKFSMETVDMINYLRLDPWFLKWMQYFQETKVCNQRNQQRLELLSYGENSPQRVYFLNAAEDTYKNNLFVNCFFLLFFKLLYCLLKKLNDKIYYNSKCVEVTNDFKIEKTTSDTKTNKRIQKQRSFEQNLEKIPKSSPFLTRTVSNLRQNSKVWTIFPAVLQANMLKLTFDCFIQLLSMFQFDFIDRLNLVATILLLLCLVIYCFSFYPMIFSLEKKKSSSNLLTTTKYGFKSFYFESIYFVFRNFIRGFIHSFFISNYSSQIALLFVTDLFFITVCVYMRNCFEFKIIAFFNVLYSVCFGCFDLFYALKVSNFDIGLKSWNEDHVGFIIIATLVVISLMISLVLLFMLIKEKIGQIVTFCKRRSGSVLPLKSEDLKIKQNIKNDFSFQVKVKNINLNQKNLNQGENLAKKFKQQLSTRTSYNKKKIFSKKENMSKFEVYFLKQKTNLVEFKNFQKQRKQRKLKSQQRDKPNDISNMNERNSQSTMPKFQITFNNNSEIESQSDLEQINILKKKMLVKKIDRHL